MNLPTTAARHHDWVGAEQWRSLVTVDIIRQLVRLWGADRIHRIVLNVAIEEGSPIICHEQARRES